MDKQEEVKALIDETAIFCGKCGHKLAVTKGLKPEQGKGTIYLKCHHKSAGVRCRTINRIDL